MTGSGLAVLVNLALFFRGDGQRAIPYGQWGMLRGQVANTATSPLNVALTAGVGLPPGGSGTSRG